MNGMALCSGAGGLELGLHILLEGYRCVAYVESDAYAAAVVVARMEEQALDPAPIWDDLKTFCGEPWRGAVDILTAGYPCQPFSIAGSKLGEEDPRHLWPFVRRAIEQVSPEIVILENVPHHLQLGFESVLSDLQRLGYAVEAGLFSAEEVGAPHERVRLFVMAVRESGGRAELRESLRSFGARFAFTGSHTELADTSSDGTPGVGALVRETDGRQIGRLFGIPERPGSRQMGDPSSARSDRAAVSGIASEGRRQDGSGGPEPERGRPELDDATREPRRHDPRQGEPGSGEGQSERSGEGGSVANPGSEGLERWGEPGNVARPAGGAQTEGLQRERGGDAASDGSATVSDTELSRLEGFLWRARPLGREELGSDGGVYLFPPRPNDSEGWGRLLQIDSSLEPAIRRDADGLAGRVDRLRCSGNGVHPIQAAVAIFSLWHAHIDRLAE